MDFQDVERQTEKQPSKIVVGELNMANEELVEVKKKQNKTKQNIILIPIEDPEAKLEYSVLFFFGR